MNHKSEEIADQYLQSPAGIRSLLIDCFVNFNLMPAKRNYAIEVFSKAIFSWIKNQSTSSTDTSISEIVNCACILADETGLDKEERLSLVKYNSKLKTQNDSLSNKLDSLSEENRRMRLNLDRYKKLVREREEENKHQKKNIIVK